MTQTETTTGQQADWDSCIETLDGDLLQRWNWGEFKRRHGWSVERVASTSGSRAQLLLRHYGPVSIAYIPRGPAFPKNGVDDLELLHNIDDACARHRAVSLILEPARAIPDPWMHHGSGFSMATRSIQSPRTVIVDLTLDDEALLRQMRKDTRYNISYARRHGVSVERAEITQHSLDEFFALLSETANRAEFGIHDRAYYADYLELFGDHSVLLFARVDGQITAGLIASRFGRSARSMYAGTRQHHGSRGDAALLRFSAMQWAREHGCTTYDLGGIAPVAPNSAEDHPAAQRPASAASLQGVETFKTGFGGEIIRFPPTLERVYRPYLAKIARRYLERAPRNSD